MDGCTGTCLGLHARRRSSTSGVCLRVKSYLVTGGYFLDVPFLGRQMELFFLKKSIFKNQSSMT